MKVRLALASTTAVLAAAVIVYFMARAPRAESPAVQAGEPLEADGELVGAELVSPAADPTTETVRRNPVAQEPPDGVSAARGANVLRVVLEGITEENAPMATVALTGLDERNEWPVEIQDSWPCQGLTSEFDLGPFLASVERHEQLRVDELEIEVAHPHHLRERARVPLSHGVQLANGKTVHEVRMQLVPPVYWPELTLAVRDAHTRAHLENVELSCVSTNYMGIPRQPGRGQAFTALGGGLSSPIVLLGGRDADDPEHRVAGLAVRPAAGEAPELFELWRQGRARPPGAIIVYARAPGYAWGSIAIDVSTDAERELLLVPAATLDVRTANVQLERYAELEMAFTLWVTWPNRSGGLSLTWRQPLDETLETEGLRLDSLEPGQYIVSVSTNAFDRHPVLLAREELSLAAGETRELMLALADPPAPPERATLGGVVSFPFFGGEEKVQLQLYQVDTYKFVGAQARYQPSAGFELSLADLGRVGGALPTWSFRLEDLPVGLYQVHLKPFLKSWMIELPAGGAEDVELVIPELAEVLVETVDAQSGERIPIDELYYRYGEVLPGQAHTDRVRAETEKPGRFRFWTAPGAVSFWPYNIPSELDYGTRSGDLELVPGHQSVRLELWHVCDIRFELRDGDAALPRWDGVWAEVYSGLTGNIRAIDHEGELMSIGKFGMERLVEVSAPGVYEVSFEGVGADRFHPIPPQRVVVHAGETAEVIVELHGK